MEDQPEPKRRKYVAPEVKKVKLDAAVLLAKGCKTSSAIVKGPHEEHHKKHECHGHGHHRNHEQGS